MSTPIDLSALPAPEIIEPLDFVTIRDAMLTDLRVRDSSYTALVASDPLYKFIEDVAYRELYLRQRINDAASAVMLAHAVGTDLDNLAAYFNVPRLVIDPGNPNAIPPVDPTYEADSDLRARILLVFDSNNTAGSANGYAYYAKTASGSVKDVLVKSPSAGNVTVSILSTTGDGVADGALVSLIDSALTADDVRPLTDNVTVQSATIVNYSVTAQLYVYSGPDQTEVLSASQASVQAHVDAMHKIGRDITLSGLYAALHVSGVQRVVMSLPASDVAITDEQAGYCTAKTITIAGIAE